MQSLSEKIRFALKAERAKRHPGVVDGLYSEAELSEYVPAATAADGSIAVLKSNCDLRLLIGESYRIAANAAIWRFLGRTDAGSSLKHGFVVAGGAPASIAGGSKIFNNIDVFLVGLNREQAFAFIRAFGQPLTARLQQLLPDKPCELIIYRTVRCVTFVAATVPEGTVIVKIQIILRLYQTVSEVLHGFDLGSSKIADDGERLYFTAEGKLAYEHGLNVVCPDVRRASYEHRLRKYWNRGFSIALPEFVEPFALSIGGDSKLRSIDLPFLKLTRVHYTPKKRLLTAATVLLNGPARAPLPGTVSKPFRFDGWHLDEDKSWEDYEATSHICMLNNMKRGDLPSRNMRAARLGRTAALCAVATFTPELDVLNIQPRTAEFAEQLSRAIFEIATIEQPPLDYLRRVIPAGSTLVEALKDLRRAGFGLEQIRDIIQRAVMPFEAKHSIPCEVAGLKETAFELSEYDGRVDPSVWYGVYFATTEGARSSIWRVLASALTGDPATITIDYMATPLPQTRCYMCSSTERLNGSGAKDVWCLTCGALHQIQNRRNVALLLPADWSSKDDPRAEQPAACDSDEE